MSACLWVGVGGCQHVCVCACVMVHVALQAAARASGAHTSESDMALVRVIAGKFNHFISEVRVQATCTPHHTAPNALLVQALCLFARADGHSGVYRSSAENPLCICVYV